MEMLGGAVEAVPGRHGTLLGTCLLGIPVHRKSSLGCHPTRGPGDHRVLARVHLGSGLLEEALEVVLGQEEARGGLDLLELDVEVVLEVVVVGVALEEGAW